MMKESEDMAHISKYSMGLHLTSVLYLTSGLYNGLQIYHNFEPELIFYI